MYKLVFKRTIDVVVSGFLIVLLAPLFLIISLIIYAQDMGTPVFKQKRVGMHQKEFVLMKFRSMPLRTENVASSEVSKIRITPFGKFIRRTNLDEFPQLLNIFLGHMSLVGPRPSLNSQLNLIELRKENNVYSCKPGLTGLAQINAYDGMTDEKKVYWDNKYLNNITFLQDLKIILKTIIYLTKRPPTY